ncbi:hypothetical protein LIER_00369 [Lithospermum erythrorhizon]|uniref:Uncharacterized protein n=1 Tax=Lithospermum erythrorhizon TaxID=34254 RepID=A0AAV3NI86_LITER
MEYEIFEQLEAYSEDDPEYLVMHDALGNFFRWIDLMDRLDREVKLQRELISHADRHLVDSIAIRRLLERDQASLSEIAVVAHRFEFYTGSVRALQARQ